MNALGLTHSNGNQVAAARRLRIYNAVVGLIHAGQGFLILALANDFTLPIVATFMTGPPGSRPPSPTPLFEMGLAVGVAVFFFISAVAHLGISAPRFFERYQRNLDRKRNYARWLEYAFSSSVMVVLIAMLAGVADIAGLIALAGVNASMILFGLLQEMYERPGRTVNWTSYWFGVIAGSVPWVVIGVYLFSPGLDTNAPAFVYGIFFSLFIFFNLFALVMVLQYRRIGPWRDYRYGESTYILLSLTSKSALAWQVFAGTLAS